MEEIIDGDGFHAHRRVCSTKIIEEDDDLFLLMLLHQRPQPYPCLDFEQMEEQHFKENFRIHCLADVQILAEELEILNPFRTRSGHCWVAYDALLVLLR